MRIPIGKVLLALAAAVILSTPAAADDEKKPETKAIQPEDVELGRPVDFERDIYPILEANCIACHNLAIAEGKLDLEEIEGILKGGKRGPAVVAKDADKSLLFQFASRQKEPAMPPLPNDVGASALTPKQLGLIRQWILEGASAAGKGMADSVAFRPLPEGINAVYSTALSRWGRFAAAGRANRIFIYDVATGEELAQLRDPALDPIDFEGKPMYPGGAAHRDLVHSLAFNPEGTLLASGGYRVVKLWQRPQNVQHWRADAPAPVTALAVSSDRNTVAIAAADNSVRLAGAADGKEIKSLAGHGAPVSGLRFSPDGSTLFTGSRDKTIRVWNIAEGKQTVQYTTPSEINDLMVNNDATQIITAGADNVIRVWKYPAAGEEAAKPLLEIKGHSGPVTALALLPPAGAQIVSGSADGSVRIWNLADGQQVRSMNHGGPVTGVAARPDGQRIASAGANNVAKLWQTGDGKQLAEIKGDLSARTTLAAKLEDQAVAKQRVSVADANLKAAENNLKEREESLKKAEEEHTKAEKAVADAQNKVKEAEEALKAAQAELEKKKDDDGLKKKVEEATKALDEAKANLTKATDNKTSAERSLNLAKKIVAEAKQTLEEAGKEKEQAEARQKQIDAELKTAQEADQAAVQPLLAVGFSPDGRRFAVASQSGTVQEFSSDSGEALASYRGHAAAVKGLVYISETSILSGSEDKSAIAWNTRPEWKLAARLGVSEEAPLELGSSPFAGRVLALDFSDDGKLLATGGGEPSRSGELMIWNVEERSLVREIPDAHSDTVMGVEFSRDGKRLLSGAADKFAKVFNAETGEHVRSYEGHTHHVLDVTWQADGTSIATAGADEVIKVWNAETGEQRRTISGYGKQVTAIDYIGIGDNVVSCSGDRQVRFHRTGNGQAYRAFGGGTDFMYAAAAARRAESVIANVNNEADFVVAGGEDGVLRMWNGANGQVIRTIDPPQLPSAEQTAQVSTTEPKK